MVSPPCYPPTPSPTVSSSQLTHCASLLSLRPSFFPFPVIIPLFRPMLSSFRIVLLTVLLAYPPPSTPPPCPPARNPPEPNLARLLLSSTSDEEGGHSSGFPFRGRGGSNSPMCGRVSAVYEKPGRSRAPTRARAGRDAVAPQPTMSIPVASPFASSAGRARRRPPPLPCGSRPSPRGTSTPANTSAQEHENPSPSPEPTGGFRNGRVKGMVHSFEGSGSESGSPERERERSGSGFRSANGSGFRSANGSGFRRRAERRRGRRRWRHGAPARPRAVGAPRAPGRRRGAHRHGPRATVRAYDYVYANGAASIAPGTTHGTNRFLNTNTANGNQELTVEELLGREDALGQPPPLQPMTPSHSGGAWRRGKRGMGMVGMPLSTGGAGDPIKQHPTGGRPLSAHPSSSSSSWSAGGAARTAHEQRRARVEADEGAVGSTMKWVPAQGRWVRRRVRIATRRSSAVYSMPHSSRSIRSRPMPIHTRRPTDTTQPAHI
ncbi:hypothetical protein B0H14DRAFT_3533545 [Mycena olivaceomarginata]|nr:hypothetical protein B0H14DRAFT_3533545 [Mycena olivaceomarginata]